MNAADSQGTPADLSHQSRLRRFAAVAAVADVALGISVLLGWTFDIHGLKHVAPGLVSMKVNTAVSFILGGVALWGSLNGRRAGAITQLTAAAALVALSAATLSEYLLDWDAGIDELLFADEESLARGDRFPGRTGLNTAIAFAAAGLALLLTRAESPSGRLASQLLAITAATIAVIGLVGYAYSVQSLYQLLSYSQMAVHTAAGLTVLGLGTLAAGARVGLLRVLTSSGPGGALARTLTPIVLVMPFVLGWLRLEGQRLGLYGTELGVAILAGSCAALFTVVIVIYAARLDRAAAQLLTAETRVRDTSGFYEEVIGSTHEGIVVVGREGRCLLWNPAMERMFGIPAFRVVGRHMGDVFPSQGSGSREAFRRALSGMTADYDVEQRNAAGEPISLAVTATPLRGAGDQVTGVILSVHDISPRVQVERALRASQQRMSAALAASQMSVWQVDPESRKSVWNENLAPLFGVADAEAPGQFADAMARIHPEDRQRVNAAVDQAIAGDQPLAVEFRVTHADGSVHWLSSSGAMTAGIGDRGPTLIGVTADVTGRRLLEAQLQQSQKMEAIGQLAGGIAHDFNNLLTAILGYARFLQERPGDARQASDIGEIIKAGTRASALTKQLLAFSRRQVIDTTVLRLNRVIEDLLGMLRRLIREDIQLVTDLADGLFPIRADRVQLEQVIVNLAVNARDAMPHGGRLVLQTANVRLDAGVQAHRVEVAAGDYVTLTISDTGSGMDDRTKSHLFEPFFTTKEPGKGTGLGLATVYGIVTQYAGYVGVVSEPERGTTFTIYLPRAEADVEATPVADAEAEAKAPEALAARPGAGRRPLKVLVVEDEKAVRYLTRIILERAGYVVVEAADPLEAEAVFDRIERVDLLVTDVVMPNGRGPDLYARLVARSPDLRVLFMSGYAGGSSGLSQLQEGQAFVEKPFSSEVLLRRIRDLLAAR